MHAPAKRERKVQRVDALVELRLHDPIVDRDAKILEKLKETVRRHITRPRPPEVRANRPSLYKRYRGNGFPLRTITSRRLPLWKALSPWMKVQMATLALGEKGFLQFKLHLHDDLRDELLRAGEDLRLYLRRNIYAHLKRRFARMPWFFFVMEEHTTSGDLTRPHAHGSIELRPLASTDPRMLRRRYRQLAKRQGLAAAQLKAGEDTIREALKSAGGQLSRPRFATTTGLDQCRNLWASEPYGALFNSHWVDYAFKNEKRVSHCLEERRLVMPHDLTGEARRLWNLIKRGEKALDQWD